MSVSSPLQRHMLMHLSRSSLRVAALAVVTGLAACSAAKEPAATATGSDAADALSAPVPASLLAGIDSATIMRHIRVLAADSLLGRAPGSEGEERTVRYIESQFRTLGLAPGNPDGSYIQKVPLVGITVTNAPTLTLTKGGQTRSLRWRDDYVAWTKHVAETASLSNSELVFVGYGVEAPEFGWDDFKGRDVTGKTLVMLVNDPPLADTARFGGPRMTYYGRWTYKYEQGMRHKAAGVLLIHDTGPAGYPFSVVQGKTGEEFDLVTPDKNMSRAAVEGWLSQEQARALMSMAGQSLDSLKAKAARADFQPVPLGVTASVSLQNRLRTVDSRNVVAKVEGSDPSLKDEYVVYTAHWDHFGIGQVVKGDSIYNGALDNASGTASLLALAAQFAKSPEKPKRSMLFLAVTAEEPGLLGSAYYAAQPLYPLAKTVANINMDGINQWGVTRDLVVIGLGASELDDYARVAASEQQRTLRPDAESEKGFYYRSDHFNFAKAGVPAFDPGGGMEYVGKDTAFARAKSDEYTANDYHRPSDEVKPDWDLAGGVLDVRLYAAMGWRVAMAAKAPEWRVGNEFRAAREKSLAGTR